MTKPSKAPELLTWPITKFIPYKKNPRKNDHAVDAIAKAISEFGFRVPIIATKDGKVVDGHLRLKAALKTGLTHLPVLLADDMTATQIKAFRLSVNKMAELAEWDFDLLCTEINELDEMDFDLSLIGFSDDELANFMIDQTEGLTDPDDIPEPPEEPVSKTGDVWLCGHHRIMCGDSTSATDVGTLLGDIEPNLMVTDPPYGVEYDASWRGPALNENYNLSIDKVLNDNNANWREAWALFQGDIAYIWHARNKSNIVYDSIISCGFNIRAQIIWVKNQGIISRGDYHPQHEPLIYAVRNQKKGCYVGGRKQTTIWNINKPQKSDTGHSTQKPVECMKRPIENNSNPGQAVYDPFLGSGTTVIAGEMTGRPVLGMELNPQYVDICVKRWMKFTGNSATLESTDETFNHDQETPKAE